MRNKIRMAVVSVAAACLTMAGVAATFADTVSNDLDATVDAVAEVMPLNVGGHDRTTQLYIGPTTGDGKNGCNLTGATLLTISIASSDTSVATVSPSFVTFTSCGDVKTLTVKPLSQGATTVSAAQVTNTTDGTFDLAPVTFTVNVSPPPNTPPSVSIAGPAEGESYEVGHVPSAMCDVTDNEDGPLSFAATLSAITGPYASDGIGQQTASCSYTDHGGLTVSSSVVYSIVDPTAPVITYTLSPTNPDGLNGWYTGEVTLTWTVTETDSPNSLTTSGCLNQDITADQQTTTYTCDAHSAGGSAPTGSVGIKRDGTAPAVNGNVTSSPIDVSGTTWYKNSANIDWTATDLTSGVVSGPTPPSSTLSGGYDQSASSSATDDAGNTGSGQVTGINVDATAPQAQITCPINNVVKGSSTSAAWTASDEDGGSGLATPASGAVSLDTSSVGPHTVYAPTAYDNVGHSSPPSNCSYSVIYSWNGFFQPIDNSGVLNVAKAGSAIPVKFSLSGDQGLGILTGSPTAAKVSCDASTPSDVIEQLATSTTSGLKYDATADQYNYTWKTASSYAGTCQKLTVQLTDGTSHTALFKFTK
jgi:hypothetical protein